MKKLMAVAAILVLGLAFGACDFGGGEDEGDATPDLIAAEITPEQVEPETAGPCEAGDASGYFFVRVQDNLENTTLNFPDDCGAGNPGADIDSICIIRDTTEAACADEVAVTEWDQKECDNDKDDPNEALGSPDGTAQDGVFEGYYSLNGGSISVSFEGDEQLLCGDLVHVVEMYNPDKPGSEEAYKVSFGETADGPWFEESDVAKGEADIELLW